MKQLLLLSLSLFLSVTTLAQNQYEGEIRLSPGRDHNDPVSGSIYLEFQSITELSDVKISLNSPLFGRTQFQAMEMFGFEHFDYRQLNAAYFLEGTPHQFHFGFVTTYNCIMGRLEGVYFRINEPRDAIIDRFKQPIDVYDLPDTWVNVGTIWLQQTNVETTNSQCE